MRLVGATVIYGNQCFSYEKIVKCASLLDKKMLFEYGGINVEFQPGETFFATEAFARWAREDRNSPFKNGRIFVTEDDKPVDVEKARKEMPPDPTAAPPFVFKDGRPDNTWKPGELMKLWTELGQPLSKNLFLATPPPGKARLLTDYMEKKGFVITGGKLVKELAT